METTQLNSYIEKGKKEMKDLRDYIADDSHYTPSQINTVDRLLTHLIVKYNYTPDWKAEFDSLCAIYFNTMRIQTKPKFQVPIHADLGIFSKN